MKKLPQWMSKKACIVQHPGSVLRDAAKVIREEAKAYRQEKNKDGANACIHIATCLENVASGKTWQEAFSLNESSGI